jgi:hypothetical protein
VSLLRNFILSTISEAAKGKGKTASLAGLQSDLRVALFNLKQRGIVRSHGKISKVSPGKYRVSVKYKGSKKDLRYDVTNFYGQFIKVA